MIIMLDTIGINVNNIPVNTPKVAGYVTGYGPVPWSDAAWKLFPHAGHVRIKQLPGNIGILNSDVIDVETDEATIDDVVPYVRTRMQNNIKWSTIYGSLSTLHACYDKLHSILGTTFYGHVDCWLSNWDLTELAATQLLATSTQNNLIAGMTCRAVQWASPISNANTLVPGSKMTLSQANIDLSVTQDEWCAA